MSISVSDADELWNYFASLGCPEMPQYRLSEAKRVMTDRRRCASCSGLESCDTQGSVMYFEPSPDKCFVRAVIGTCKLRKQQDERMDADRIFGMSEIPLLYRDCRIDNYLSLNPSCERAKLAAVKAGEAGMSLILSGSTGVGKTHLAAGIAFERMGRGETTLFVSTAEYLSRLRSCFDDNSSGQYEKMMHLVKNVSCLVVDDFGIERFSAWAVERIYDLINSRMENVRQTIITLGFACLADMLPCFDEEGMVGQRIVSRLTTFGWVRIEGEDYRRNRTGLTSDVEETKGRQAA